MIRAASGPGIMIMTSAVTAKVSSMAGVSRKLGALRETRGCAGRTEPRTYMGALWAP
ncbi:hypothetical protein GCM10010412_039770 [Nonomuraea recticatena]|uniref:Uncharacterized protein n=1 Tax=Nonomuraea recticatena TaxID=46178 RepID=A0ABP6ED00_9ACTN